MVRNRVILVWGLICVDRVRRIPHLPPAGGYVEIEDESFLLGGEAANTANALAAWNRPLSLSGNSLGQGQLSELLRSELRQRGIALTHLNSPDGSTPVCDVYVTPDGDRTMFGQGFRAMEIACPAEDLPWESCQWFTAEPNLDQPAREVVRAAHERGKSIYLMDFLRDNDPVYPGTYWQCSTDWRGIRGNTLHNVELMKGWVDQTGAFGILSDGPNGFVAGSPSHPVRHYEPFPAPGMVDTTGAGDMFRAGMLYGLSQDLPVVRCLQFAAVAGALKCQYLGATTRVPSVPEIEAHLAEHRAIADRYH